jgi:hypothetical protein
MSLKTLIVIALLGLMLIAVLSFAQAAPPSDKPGNIPDTIAGLKTEITELWGNATAQESAIQAEADARLSGDQALWTNATEQQNAIDAIVSISPERCPEGQYVIGIDQDGKIICAPVCPIDSPNYCPDSGECVNLLNDPKNCGECSNSCEPGFQCINGECVCQPPLDLCGLDCVDLGNDEQNCGRCGIVCPPDQKCIGGKCLLDV